MLKNGIKIAHNKSLKISYKELNYIQKKIVKLKENQDLIQKELYGFKGFYVRSPKTESGGIDWDKIDDKELDFFERITKENDSVNRVLSKYSDDEIKNAMQYFNNSQFSYSQSF